MPYNCNLIVIADSLTCENEAEACYEGCKNE